MCIHSHLQVPQGSPIVVPQSPHSEHCTIFSWFTFSKHAIDSRKLGTFISALASSDSPGTFNFLHNRQWHPPEVLCRKTIPQPSSTLSRPPQGSLFIHWESRQKIREIEKSEWKVQTTVRKKIPPSLNAGYVIRQTDHVTHTYTPNKEIW